MKGQTLDVYVYVSDYVYIHIDMIIEQDIYSMQIELLILTGHTWLLLASMCVSSHMYSILPLWQDLVCPEEDLN